MTQTLDRWDSRSRGAVLGVAKTVRRGFTGERAITDGIATRSGARAQLCCEDHSIGIDTVLYSPWARRKLIAFCVS